MCDDFKEELTEKQSECIRLMRRIANIGIVPGINMWYIKKEYTKPHKFNIRTVKFEDSSARFSGYESIPEEEYANFWARLVNKTLTDKSLGKNLFFSYAAAQARLNGKD